MATDFEVLISIPVALHSAANISGFAAGEAQPSRPTEPPGPKSLLALVAPPDPVHENQQQTWQPWTSPTLSEKTLNTENANAALT